VFKSKIRKSKTTSGGAESKHNEIQFRWDGIFLARGDEAASRIADPILVTAFATDREPGTKKVLALTVIRFRNRRGKWKTENVPSFLLVSGRQEFIKLLSSRGYSWPPNTKFFGHIIGALSAEKPVREIRVTAVTGWHDKSFALPGECYGPEGPDKRNLRIVHNATVRLGAFRRLGTLDVWKNLVAKKCVHSSRARLAIACNFAAPNLRMMGLNSFGFNFSGVTSGGKTLLLRVAASTSGLNGNGGPTTWDGTPAAFEQRIQGHRDCIVLFDEIGYLEGDPKAMIKFMTFRLAGNRGKEKAGQYVMSQNLVEADCRVIALSTSEDPLWEHLDKAGRRRIRGEEVRMINVRGLASRI
jgi:putative DNA primase/helicase